MELLVSLDASHIFVVNPVALNLRLQLPSQIIKYAQYQDEVSITELKLCHLYVVFTIRIRPKELRSKTINHLHTLKMFPRLFHSLRTHSSHVNTYSLHCTETTLYRRCATGKGS